MNIAMTKMSSRGQVVIPLSMRNDISEGEMLIVIEDKGDWLIKKASKASLKFKEDMKVARRVEEAYKRIEQGDCKTMSSEDFLKEIATW
jgi:bifunctional DNA-binding transcriptional regulator/antitoxin component of YhaV-PrlF toxin-antitoxin module